MGFKDRLSPNTGQKHCRMLLLEHTAILLTCNMLPFAIKTFVLSIFEKPLKTELLYLILKESAYKIYCRCLSANKFLEKSSPRKCTDSGNLLPIMYGDLIYKFKIIVGSLILYSIQSK